MFSFLSRKPRVPSAEILAKVEKMLEGFNIHVNETLSAAREAIPNLDILGPDFDMQLVRGLDEGKSKLEEAKTEIQVAKEYLRAAKLIWPEGKPIFSELNIAMDCFTNLLENAGEMNRLLGADDILTGDIPQRVRTINRNNRLYGAEGDKHMIRGYTLLESWTGLKMLRGDEGDR